MAPDLGGFDVLNLYAEAIQKMNINPNIPQLFRDIFKNAYLPYRDPETLKSFLKVIDDFEYDHSERLGDAFEYLLSVLGSQGEAGQFRTPRHIIDFMVDIISPKKDNTILDPACGTAGFLISSYKHILKHNSSNFVPEKDKDAYEQTDVSIAELTSGGTIKYKGDKLLPDERAMLSKNIKGYDISPDMVRLSLVNLYLHGFTDPKIQEYDTLTSEDNWNEYADVILANPPFMSPKGGIKPHKRFSIQSNRSEVLFVDYMVEHLTPNGKAAIIVPEGIMFQSGTAYKQLRKMLVENYLFAVVSLPAGVFNPYSGVKTSILLIDKALNKKTDKILFVKIENDGFDLGAQRRPNNKSQLPTAASLVKEYISICHSGLDPESKLTEKFGQNNLWNIATKEKIAENDDWNLSGERYKKFIARNTKYKTVPLASICRVINGRAYKQDELLEWGKYPVLRVGNFFSNREWYYSDLELEEDKYCDNGDLLYAWSASFGPKIWDGGKVIYHYHIWKMVPDQNLIDKRFLYHILDHDTEEIKAQGGRGIAMIHITKEGIEKRQIPLPPLEIQKEIVAEIEGWQKIIEGARQVVENYKPQIDIDPEWPMVELGSLSDLPIQSGAAITKNDINESGDFFFVNIRDLYYNRFIDTLSLPKVFDKGFDKSLLRKGDILFVRVSLKEDGVGYNSIYLDKFKNVVYGDNIFRLTPNTDKVNPLYLYYLLRCDYMRQQIISKSMRANVTSINQSTLKSLLIPLPSMDIQNYLVEQFEKEYMLIEPNKTLITIFEQKIKDKIAKVWGE